MSDSETCEHRKPYPCFSCPDPCAEEQKRRQFYEECGPHCEAYRPECETGDSPSDCPLPDDSENEDADLEEI